MFIMVFVTAVDKLQAERIAEEIIKKKLAACVNIAGGVDSVFWWKKTIDCSQEILLIMKTRKDLFEELAAAVKAVHSYEVPEIIAVDISVGSPEYLQWIDENVKR